MTRTNGGDGGSADVVENGGALRGPLRRAARSLGVPWGVAWLRGASGDYEIVCAGPPDAQERIGVSPLLRALCDWVVHTGEPLLLEEVRAHPIGRVLGEAELGEAAFAGVPVPGRDGEVAGSVAVLSATPHEWDEKELATLRAAAEEVRRAAFPACLADGTIEEMLELSPLPMWVHDSETLRFLAVNDPAVRQYGYTRDEFLARTLREIWPAESLADSERGLRERAGAAVHRVEETHLRRDGQPIRVEVATREVPFGGRAARLALALDVTASRAAAEADRYLAEASAALMTALDYRDRLKSLARLSVPRLADYCIIDVVEEGGRVSRIEAAHADPEREGLVAELLRFPPVRHRPGGVAEVLRTGAPIRAREMDDALLARSTACDDHLRLLRALGPRSTLIVPLAARGRTLGAITFVMAESGRRYGRREAELAKEVAHRAGIAIDNARLYRRALRATRAREEVLGVVSRELRDPLHATLVTLDMVLDDHHEELSPPLRSRIEAIHHQTQRMVTLMDGLTDAVAREPGHGARPRRPEEAGAGEAPRREGASADLLRDLSDPGAGDDDPATRLRAWITRALHLGQLRPGDRLPSIREVACACGTTKHTIVRVYRELERDGLIETRERCGIYVADPAHREGELHVEAGEWLASVLGEACALQLRVPTLPDLIARWTSTVRAVCACVESDLDHRAALCGEYSTLLGLDCVPVAADFLEALPRDGLLDPDDLPPEIRGADLLLTTCFHAPGLRAVAERLRKPLVVATADPEVVSAIESRIREARITAVCADRRFADRLVSLYPDAPAGRLRVVLAGDREALDRLDPAEPVLVTRAAREMVGDRPFRLLSPYFPRFSLHAARELARLVVQLNLAAERRAPLSL